MHLNIYIDGACRGNPGPSSIGVVLMDQGGATLKEYKSYIGEHTNNEAEYTALSDALRLAAEMGAKTLKIHSDSQLMVRQYNGQYRVKNQRLMKHLLQIQSLRRNFESVELVHVPREQNRRADALANEALDEAARVLGSKPAPARPALEKGLFD